MTINSIKDLQKVIALCKKTGVTSIKIDNIELSLSLEASNPKAYQPRQDLFPEEKISVPTFNGGISADTTIPDNIDMPDELSEEQLMMWSSLPESSNETL